MKDELTQKEYKKKIKLINYYNQKYYNDNISEISDSEYDELKKDILASKEMYLGRHYIKKGKWIAAINRFKVVTKEYDQTVFIEEALHRLVEINYKLGLVDESQKYANILGYNYLSSEWYKKSYRIFNQNYKVKLDRTIKKDKKSVLEKFKKLFD